MKSENAREYLFEDTTDEREFQRMDDLIPIHDALKAVELAESELSARIEKLEAENARLKEAGRWRNPNKELPGRIENVSYSQVPCLVKYRGDIQILCFNHEHECWDDESGDDYKCEITNVEAWKPLD